MSKEEILKYCRDLLYGSISNYPIQKGDFDFLTNKIFPLHDKFTEKCNGKRIKSVIIHPHPEYRNKCFALVLEDNSLVDISFIECIYKKGLKENIESACCSAVSDVSQKAKEAVRGWIKTLELGELTVGLCLTGYGTPHVRISDENLLNNFISYYNGRE